MESLHDQIANRCVHFNGVMEKVCKAGISYRDVRDETMKPYGFPCLKTGGMCDKCQFPTEEEVRKEIEEIQIGSSWALSTLLKVKEEIKIGEHGYGSMPCDCGGTIHYSVAEINGHARAACDKCKNSIME